MISSDPKTPDSAHHDEKSKEASSSSIGAQIAQESNQGNNPVEGEEVEGDDGEEGECGFCLYMKGGGCRDAFIDWENCVKEAEDNGENIVNKCFGVTSALRECMQAHSEYYEPILRAEKAAEEDALKDLEKEKEKEKSSKESLPNAADNQEKVLDSKDSKSDDEMAR